VPIKCREPSEFCESVLDPATAVGRRIALPNVRRHPLDGGAGDVFWGTKPDAGQLGSASGCRPSMAARVRGGSAKIIVDRAGYRADSGSVDRATKKLTDMTQEACLLVWLRERYKQIYSYPFKLPHRSKTTRR
jgi:hypothetical protein